MFGKLFHLGMDALIISAFLAGVKRSTGLTPALSQVPNKDIRQMLRTYLEFGEYAFDFAVVVFGVTAILLCISDYITADDSHSALVLSREGIELASLAFATS
ncbi:hypothetical protein AZE42_01877 [Rhizopogon vesiculosus]|uniref:DUF1748-domain-containing protein n=1 Tax=Rhizopogon vesiculosus TaxID=180088 RepID=A0A1J8PIR6_9AGAM|nr:hypothetical protein AZE42_01877 [Rhizopogon vesiculosus]